MEASKLSDLAFECYNEIQGEKLSGKVDHVINFAREKQISDDEYDVFLALIIANHRCDQSLIESDFYMNAQDKLEQKYCGEL